MLCGQNFPSCTKLLSLFFSQAFLMPARLIFGLSQEDQTSETGDKADIRECTLTAHTCFLIKSMSQREEHIRDISVTLLTRLRDRFPQVKVLFLFNFWLEGKYCSLVAGINFPVSVIIYFNISKLPVPRNLAMHMYAVWMKLCIYLVLQLVLH